MENSNIPAKFPIPFANAAGSSFIRAIPETSQIGVTNGAASLTDGFPPNCFSPLAAGGAPPFGQDFNGLLNQVTAWQRWNQAGGPITFDATFQKAIGGYPSTAIIQSSVSPGLYWRSTVDNNLTNPDEGGAGWVSAFSRLINVRYFQTPGVTTYTPTPGTSSVIVEIQGAGGASGGAPATNSGQNSSGGGGGSGAWSRKLITSGFSGATITIGAPGLGASGQPGTDGGATSFGTIFSANGGKGGSTAGPSGANTIFLAQSGLGGEAGTSGDLNLAGVQGAIGLVVDSQGIDMPQVVGMYLGSYGAGGAPVFAPVSSPAVAGTNGQPGLCVIWEYS